MKTKGTVTKAMGRDGRFGIELGEGNWFNGFGDNPTKIGDVVEFEYIENEGNQGRIFKNVKPEDVKVLDSAPEIPSGQEIGLKKKLINECVMKAVDVLNKQENIDLKPSAIKEIAKMFYNVSTDIFNDSD